MPAMEMAAISAARWVVGKALSPLSDGIVEAWAATSKLGPNIDALKMELLYAHGMLNNASDREIHNESLAELLQKLRDLAYGAKDVLDELDYFRIQDQLEATYETVDRGCFKDFIRDTRHTTKAAASKLTSCLCCCCAHEADPDELEEEDAVADPRASGCMLRLASGTRNAARTIGKGLLCFSSPPADGESDHRERTPKLELNRVDLSKRMKGIVDELQPVCAKVATILNLELLSSDRNTTKHNTANRLKTGPITEDPELYGRVTEMEDVVDGITNKFRDKKDMTIIPVVGHGGVGKTTFAQHVYDEAEKYFQARIWICVSSSYNVNKLMQEIVQKIPEVKEETNNTSDEELIAQRLKSRRFLLVLDDIWKCHEDEWKRLLAPFRKGEEKGNMVLVTTRIPELVAKLGITEHLIVLTGLAKEPFEDFFKACAFGKKELQGDELSLYENTGKNIVDKLKGFPLAAKTVGRLLRGNLSEDYWRRVLESKEWELTTDDHDIMPALKLSYDYLPFHLQQCFAYCALFPEDYEFDREELIQFWIGLEILHTSGQNKRAEDIGASYLDDLLSHGFFIRGKKRGLDYYVLHDLLRDLALNISSNESLSICYSNVRSIEVHPPVRHLSIIFDDADQRSGMTDEHFIRELRRVKKRLQTKNLHTLMLFDNGRLTGCIGYLFKEVSSLRVLHVSEMIYPVKYILENFSKLLHLRYLRLGSSEENKIQLPRTISRLYHLRILHLKAWDSCLDLPSDMSNLVNLFYFLAVDERHHAEISMVGKLTFLRELKRFNVKKNKEGFELKQLEPLMELNRLGIYNLENALVNETAEAKLEYKKSLHILTLQWGNKVALIDRDVTNVLESLRPHSNLKELRIIGHRGSTCPKWLGSDLCVRSLESLHLDGVDWKDFPALGELRMLKQLKLERVLTMTEFNVKRLGHISTKSFSKLKRIELVGLEELTNWVGGEALFSATEELVIKDCRKLKELQNLSEWFRNLQLLEIKGSTNISSFPPIPWTDKMCNVDISNVMMGSISELSYKKDSPTEVDISITWQGSTLFTVDEKMLAFDNLAELQSLTLEGLGITLAEKHLHKLTSLDHLYLYNTGNVLLPSCGGQDDVKWQLRARNLAVDTCSISGKNLTRLLYHLPELSCLDIILCNEITGASVMLEDKKQTTMAMNVSSAYDTDIEDGQSQQRQRQQKEKKQETVAEVQDEEDGLLLFPPHLCSSLQYLVISACSSMSLLQQGGGLQDLCSLVKLSILHGCPLFSAYATFSYCPFPSSLKELTIQGSIGMEAMDSQGEGLWRHLLTQCHHITYLKVRRCPKFFAGWENSRKQEELRLRELELVTTDTEGIFMVPVCSLLSASLTKLSLYDDDVPVFTDNQENALQLLTSLQRLEFSCATLGFLPKNLVKLSKLEEICLMFCYNLWPFSERELPSSLKILDVRESYNPKLKDDAFRENLQGIILLT